MPYLLPHRWNRLAEEGISFRVTLWNILLCPPSASIICIMRLCVLLPSEPPNLFCSQISLNRGSASAFSPLFKAAFFLELVFSRLTRVIPSLSGIVLDTGLGDRDMQLASCAKCLEGKHFIHYLYITNMTYR